MRASYHCARVAASRVIISLGLSFSRMLPDHKYPIPQCEPLIWIIRGPRTSGSKGKGQFCCQQYACAHQDNAEWVVGWHFEHRWLLLQKEPQARVRARLGPRARAWVRNTYARPPGRQSIRKPVTLLRLDINVTAGGISSSAVSRCGRGVDVLKYQPKESVSQKGRPSHGSHQCDC